MMQLRRLITISSGFLLFVTTLFAQSEAGTQLILPSKLSSISFSWQGDFIDSKWEPNVAMVIPVTLKGCPRTFYMQFDLGAPSSVFYKNKLEGIKTKYPNVIPRIEAADKIKEFSFWADRTYITAKEVRVKQFDTSAINWLDKKAIEIIGTIGSDLIDGKVVILDYPHRKINILQELTEKLKQAVSLTHFTYINKSVLLPAKVNGKETLLFFDTGSSMFELLTSKETCIELARPDAQPVQYEVKSWNRTLTAHTLLSDKSIDIANITLPLHAVSYIEGASGAQTERMLKAGIGGMTGNKLFLNHTLILDTRSRQFGLTRSLKKGIVK